MNILTLTSGTLKVNKTVPLSGSSSRSDTLIRTTSTGNERLYSPGLQNVCIFIVKLNPSNTYLSKSLGRKELDTGPANFPIMKRVS